MYIKYLNVERKYGQKTLGLEIFKAAFIEGTPQK